MRRFMLIAATASLLGVVGCKNNKKTEVAEAPPPPPPTVVEPQPVYFETTPMPAPEPAPMPASRTYVVQKGDTIYAISRKLYGSNARAKDIIAANPGINPDRIKVGQVLNLP